MFDVLSVLVSWPWQGLFFSAMLFDLKSAKKEPPGSFPEPDTRIVLYDDDILGPLF